MNTATREPVVRRPPELVAVDGRKYPLESARVTARAEGGIAATTLAQRFANPHDETLEVVYVLPLPADGAVLGYTVRIGETVIRGEVQPREKAEESYRRALYEGRTAGLLEQDRADTFQQRLGNVPPHVAVEVEIEVLHPLAFVAATDRGRPQWEYRFPTVAGVRYEGAPGRVGDAGRLDVDRAEDGGIPTRMDLSVTLADAVGETAEVSSPSHALVRESTAAGTRVGFAEGQRLDRDVVLRWPAATREVGVRLVEGGGLAGDDGRYGLLTVIPPEVVGTSFRRDLTVLIDASGSMGGPPLELAKHVVGELIESLESDDRFELIAFANQPRSLTGGMVGANDSTKRKALGDLRALQAGGGTEMLHAVEEALRPLRQDSQRQVVLVTDGYIGFEGEIVGRLAGGLPRGCRAHAVGIGAAPNRTLLAGVARAGRGVEVCAGDDATAAEAARRILAATVRPVLTDVGVSGSAVRGLAPARARDVFAGQPLVLTVELERGGGSIRIEGRLAGAARPWSAELTAAAAGADAGVATTPLPIGALHGREVIADLELEGDAGGSRAGVDAKIEARGMRHRIASRRTSLVAIAETPSVDPRQPRRQERLAVEVPAGVSAEGAGLFVGAATGVMAAFGPFMKTMAAPAAQATMSRLVGRVRAEPEEAVASAALEIEATVIHAEAGMVVVEFASPEEKFFRPRGALEVTVAGAKIGVAEVVAERSSPRGPHARGLILRLALRLREGAAWPAGVEVRVEGEYRRFLAARRVALHFTIPPAP